MRAVVVAIVLLTCAGGACGSTPDSADASSDGIPQRDAAGSGSAGDPYAAARATCLAKINSLRATESKPAYAEWTSAPETCVDHEATSDEMLNMPHHAWSSGSDSCKGNAQNECEGQGVAGIAACLDSMWAEKNQADCSGCDACASAYNPSCPNCDFFGTQHGQVCGHYVNLSALYFTKEACGFSSLGGWDAINFE
jgi:hypothetical protein